MSGFSLLAIDGRGGDAQHQQGAEIGMRLAQEHSTELKEMLEAKMGEYEERIEQLERLNRASTGADE